MSNYQKMKEKGCELKKNVFGEDPNKDDNLDKEKKK